MPKLKHRLVMKTKISPNRPHSTFGTRGRVVPSRVLGKAGPLRMKKPQVTNLSASDGM